MRTKLRFWEKFQVQIGLNWYLFPCKSMTWKKWLFDPEFGITWPGQKISSRNQLPESSNWTVDTESVEDRNGFKSLVFWVHGALRVLGLDIGVGFFWRTES